MKTNLLKTMVFALPMLFLASGITMATDEEYDFKTWIAKKQSKALTLSATTATVGSTTVYEMENFVGDGDTNHSLGGRFYYEKVTPDATEAPYGWTKLEAYATATVSDELKTAGLHLRGKGIVSIQNLHAGDVIVITHNLEHTAETNADGLYVLSKNASYEIDGATKVSTGTTKTAGNALISDKEYTMLKDGSFDFKNSGSDEYYINKVVIKPIAASSIRIGSTGYATFSSESKVTFAGTGVQVFWASGYADGKVQFTEITSGIVPANTGVLLKAAAGNYTYTTTDATSDAYSENLLKNIKDDATKVKAPATADGKTTTNYLLAQKGGVTGFYKVDEQRTGLGGKAYLQIVTEEAAARESITFDFGSGTTGIQELKNAKIEESESYYNLAGQRVEQPTKGLYIVSGKKVIIK